MYRYEVFLAEVKIDGRVHRNVSASVYSSSNDHPMMNEIVERLALDFRTEESSISYSSNRMTIKKF